MLIDLISRSSEHHCVSQFLFVYYRHTFTGIDQLPIKPTIPSRIEWKEIRSIGGGKKTTRRRVADKRVSKWERNEGKKHLSQTTHARVCMCMCTQLAITTAIKRSTRPARFNVSIAIFTMGIACTPGGHLSTPITHSTTRFEWRKLARFLNNTRSY